MDIGVALICLAVNALAVIVISLVAWRWADKKERETFPRMTVDSESRAIYVYLQAGDIYRTVEVDAFESEILIDVDEWGHALGVEILTLVRSD